MKAIKKFVVMMMLLVALSVGQVKAAPAFSPPGPITPPPFMPDIRPNRPYAYYLPLVTHQYTAPSSVGIVIDDNTDNELPSYLDIVRWSMTPDYVSILELRDLPDALMVNRDGVEAWSEEYAWEVTIHAQATFAIKMWWTASPCCPTMRDLTTFPCMVTINGQHPSLYSCTIDTQDNTVSFSLARITGIEDVTAGDIGVRTFDALYGGESIGEGR